MVDTKNWTDYLGLGLGIVGISIGAILLYDDYKDLSDTVRENHPSPLHHWMWGSILLALGSGATSFFAAKLLNLIPQGQPEQLSTQAVLESSELQPQQKVMGRILS